MRLLGSLGGLVSVEVAVRAREPELELAVAGFDRLLFRQPVQLVHEDVLDTAVLGVAKCSARRQAASRRSAVYLSASLMSARTGRIPSTALSAKISRATSATDGPSRWAHRTNPSWVRFRYCSSSGGACSGLRLTCHSSVARGCAVTSS